MTRFLLFKKLSYVISLISRRLGTFMYGPWHCLLFRHLSWLLIQDKPICRPWTLQVQPMMELLRFSDDYFRALHLVSPLDLMGSARSANSGTMSHGVSKTGCWQQ